MRFASITTAAALTLLLAACQSTSRHSSPNSAPPLQSLRHDLAPGQIIDYNDFGEPGETHFFPDPTHRTGVMVFCDDALGTTIGVVMTALWESNDFEHGWLQERRFWQEKDWSLDVTSFGWSRDGRHLFVGTNDIYGTGNLYQLDLFTRRSTVLFPREHDESLDGHCWSSEIEHIGDETVRFHVRDYCDNDTLFVQRTVPFLTVDSEN